MNKAAKKMIQGLIEHKYIHKFVEESYMARNHWPLVVRHELKMSKRDLIDVFGDTEEDQIENYLENSIIDLYEHIKAMNEWANGVVQI